MVTDDLAGPALDRAKAPAVTSDATDAGCIRKALGNALKECNVPNLYRLAIFDAFMPRWRAMRTTPTPAPAAPAAPEAPAGPSATPIEPMVDMVPPATSRDRWMYKQGRLAELEDMCARIKAADDAAASGDYMLDSDDCIAILRGTWTGPLANDRIFGGLGLEPLTPSLSDLQSQIQQLEAKRDELKAAAAAQRQTDIAAVVDDLRTKIAEYGISAKELGLQGRGRAPTKGTRRISAVRTSPTDAVTHRGPNGQTWTSGTRGRKPHWLAEEIAKSAGVVTD